MPHKKTVEELLSVKQRQILMRRTQELEDLPMRREEESLVESRLAAHRKDPAASLSLDEFKKRLGRRSAK